jgi:hypothetical protein
MVLQNDMRSAFAQFSGFGFEVHGLFLRLLGVGIFGVVGEVVDALFHEDAVDLGVGKEKEAHEVYFGDEVKIL